ncbi:DUF1801 domain-containing protein [Hyphomonas johnsonii]|jgi:hypothetical protein|uniref:YdhG-like domain-containing protein n=1 Tax=Hyphomonas johnsonii MHS-2 TaxID=1280950 RepID=A0A059FFS1_9PROT|nr:DUF1801 domain-containing protein [Hyphomonas johnsonii]KCZ89464.1 hypothetical protein HJO_14637 [Hyphomonas johnsonii MHS-2]
MPAAESVIRAPKTRVERYVASLSDPQRRAEGEALLELFAGATELPATIWGTSKIGYGRYAYSTPSGRKSEFMMAGFEPAKKHIVVYLSPDFETFTAPLENLGKHDKGKSCVFIKALKDVNLTALEELVRLSFESTEKNFKTSET